MDNDPYNKSALSAAEKAELRSVAVRSLRDGTGADRTDHRYGCRRLHWVSRGIAAFAPRCRSRGRRQFHTLLRSETQGSAICTPLCRARVHSAANGSGGPGARSVAVFRLSAVTLCAPCRLRRVCVIHSLTRMPMCSRTSWRFSMYSRAAGTSALVTSSTLRRAPSMAQIEPYRFPSTMAADHPVSFYAATKRSNEFMAHSYSHLFGLPATGLRFFTVYGPWGRPDMAVYIFTRAIAEGKTIEVANAGRVWRDFTYVDDIVEGVVRALAAPPRANPNWDFCTADPATSSAPHRVYNIGNDRPEEINRLISIIETALGRRARRIDVPLPPGDVLETSRRRQRSSRCCRLRTGDSARRRSATLCRMVSTLSRNGCCGQHTATTIHARVRVRRCRPRLSRR